MPRISSKKQLQNDLRRIFLAKYVLVIIENETNETLECLIWTKIWNNSDIFFHLVFEFSNQTELFLYYLLFQKHAFELTWKWIAIHSNTLSISFAKTSSFKTNSLVRKHRWKINFDTLFIDWVTTIASANLFSRQHFVWSCKARCYSSDLLWIFSDIERYSFLRLESSFSCVAAFTHQ